MSDTQSIYKFVLGLNETGGTFLAYPSISKYVWTITNCFHLLGCTAQSRSSVITQTTWRLPVFDHRLHLRLIVVSVIQNGINPVFPNNSRIFYKSATQTQHTPHSNSSVTNRKLIKRIIPQILTPKAETNIRSISRKPFCFANRQLVSKFHIHRERFPLILSKINSLNLFFNLLLNINSKLVGINEPYQSNHLF